MHLWPRGRRNLGPLQGVPPVQRTGHPHRLEPNPYHRTARRMADAVPGDPATHHRPQADGGTRGGPQGTRPHCRLHLTTHPRGGPPGHGGAHAADARCQDSRGAHILHPQIPAACSNPAPNRPSPPPQTPVLPTMRAYPVTYQHGTPQAYAPSTERNTGTAHRGTTGTAHTPTSMAAPPAPIPPRHRLSTGTTDRQSPHVPSAYASGYHRRPCPTTQTTGSAWEPHTASPTAPTAGTSTPTDASGPRPQPQLPSASHPSFFGPAIDTLRDHLGGYYVVDAADQAWTIAVAMGSTPLPPHSPLSAQISATTKRGRRPWAGPPWGPGNRGAGLLLPPPPPTEMGLKAGPAQPPPPQHALAPPHPHCRPSHGDQGPPPHGQGADAERWVCWDLGPAW